MNMDIVLEWAMAPIVPTNTIYWAKYCWSAISALQEGFNEAELIIIHRGIQGGQTHIVEEQANEVQIWQINPHNIWICDATFINQLWSLRLKVFF